MTAASVIVRRLTASETRERIGDVAALRIAVFREWPYLYDGDPAYEQRYLQPYVTSARAVIIGAFDEDRLVGASTASPLADHAEDFAAPFARSGERIGDWYYLAESVLLPEYRGQGVGIRFFEERERAARDFGFDRTAFCAVERPSDHPDRPQGYEPLDSFWRKRGYARRPDLVAHFQWKDIGERQDTEKPLTFWVKRLG